MEQDFLKSLKYAGYFIGFLFVLAYVPWLILGIFLFMLLRLM